MADSRRPTNLLFCHFWWRGMNVLVLFCLHLSILAFFPSSFLRKKRWKRSPSHTVSISCQRRKSIKLILWFLFIVFKYISTLIHVQFNLYVTIRIICSKMNDISCSFEGKHVKEKLCSDKEDPTYVCTYTDLFVLFIHLATCLEDSQCSI